MWRCSPNLREHTMGNLPTLADPLTEGRLEGDSSLPPTLALHMQRVDPIVMTVRGACLDTKDLRHTYWVDLGRCREYVRTSSSPPSIDPRLPDDGTTEKSFNDVLSDVHERALEVAGFGRLQWVLMVVLGFGIMGDAIELMVMAYILPGAERELCMSNQMKGWLGE